MKKTSRRSIKSTRYKKTPPKTPCWGLWDILFLQLIFCLLIALNAWWEPEPFRSWLCDAQQPELTLPLPEEEQWQELQESVAAFLNQYIYEESPDAVAAMGGLYPMEPLAQIPFSTTEAPQGMTFRKVQTESQLSAPLSGTITSPFGYREHPITGEADFHTGIDIAAGEGTAIHCAADGVVTETGWSDIYGNYLVVQHSDNFRTKYAHCSRLIAQQGDVLRRGERIALVGSTGVSTGPHLHFETIVEELRCDPLWLLPL